MKFAAVAAAVLSLCVACEKDGDVSIEGKQWIVEFDGNDGLTKGVIDLGYTEKGKISFGLQNTETKVWEETGWMDMGMSYTIEDKGNGSGIISYSYVWRDEEYVERIVYSELTATSVKFDKYTFINTRPVLDPETNEPTGETEEFEDGKESTMFWGIVYDEPATLSTEKIVIELL